MLCRQIIEMFCELDEIFFNKASRDGYIEVREEVGDMGENTVASLGDRQMSDRKHVYKRFELTSVTPNMRRVGGSPV